MLQHCTDDIGILEGGIRFPSADCPEAFCQCRIVDNGELRIIFPQKGTTAPDLCRHCHGIGLMAQGLAVTVVEAAPQILPNVLDSEMAAYIQRQLQGKGLQILTGVKASSVLGDAKATGLQTEMGPLNGDLIIASAGIRPNTAFLQDIGLEMTKGTILVNEHLQTNLPDIYAAGDCAMSSKVFFTIIGQ